MLVKTTISKMLIDFANKVKDVEQTDTDKVIREYADNIEEAVYKAIKSVDIVIPSGMLNVQGPGGPSSNAQPIIIKSVLK